MTMKEREVARNLGLFSLALGAVELLAPRAFSRATGLEGRAGLVAGFGLREIGTGAGLLASERLEPWVWGRVAGDVLDAALLGSALRVGNPRRRNAAIALVAVLGVAAIDVACARTLRRRERNAARTFPRAAYVEDAAPPATPTLPPDPASPLVPEIAATPSSPVPSPE